jgi:hypothetical protein
MENNQQNKQAHSLLSMTGEEAVKNVLFVISRKYFLFPFLFQILK